jgi:phytoene/squalene synthetase
VTYKTYAGKPQEEERRGLIAIDLNKLGADYDFSLMPELFPPQFREHVRNFGRFVRLADGIADSPILTQEQKLERLEALEAALLGGANASWSDEARATSEAIRESVEETGITREHARHVIQAFQRDVSGTRIKTWSDLIVYCQFAAAPIGRYMLDLLGENMAVCGPPTDALCTALRILKRLRDCKDPTAQYKRLCIPEQFMRDASITTLHLQAPSAKGQTRAVIDRMLDGVEGLLTQAEPLPRLIMSRGLSLHTAIVLCRARKLAIRFRRQDPLNERVELSNWQRRTCKWQCVIKSRFGWR